MYLSRNALLLVAGLLTGCLPAIERPDGPVFPGEARFSRDIPTAAHTDDPAAAWWRRTIDDAITDDLEAALSVNAALRRAEAEIAAATARLEQTRANQGPALTLGADAGASKAQGSDLTGSTALGIDGGLPIDLNGALALREDAAAQLLQAAVDDTEQLRSDLARDYLLALFDAAEAGQRRDLLDEQIQASRTLLRLIELRFTQGLASSVDVLQQRDELASLRQQIPAADLDRTVADNALREIAGRTPGQSPPSVADRLPVVDSGFLSIAPNDLLSRRAGLRADRARLAAADDRFAAALADRLPTLSLSGRALSLTASGNASTLISASLDAAFTLFDSGLKTAIAEEARAQLAAAGHAYLANWLNRVIELDNLISTESGLRDRIDLSRQRLETAEALLAAAQRRYDRGVSDYLPVLAALRGLQQQQRDHLSLRATLGRVRIRLHHAQGTMPGDNA